MSNPMTVLLLGGTGRTGRRVLQQLLSRGVTVRAIVRSREKLPPETLKHSALELIEAELLSLSDEDLQRYVRGCGAVVSCLGHIISFKGVFGPPYDLVTRATTRVCRAIEALQPASPVKFILMSSVSVNRPGGLDTRRGALEKAFLWVLRGLLPPAGDNQNAADFLLQNVAPNSAFVQWTAVRPDSLLDGDVTPYELHEGLVNSLFKPGSTNMANVAHFMCELATNPDTWATWHGKLPVIVNTAAAESTAK